MTSIVRAELYTTGEVARLLGVNPKTVQKWARTGQLTCIRTLGGHRRFDGDLIDAIRETPHNPAPVPVTPMMAAGHYSQPLNDTGHSISFEAKLAFTGPSPAQYAYLAAYCATCNERREIGSPRTLPDLIRWCAQHAGRDAVVLLIADTLKAIAPDGSDLG